MRLVSMNVADTTEYIGYVPADRFSGDVWIVPFLNAQTEGMNTNANFHEMRLTQNNQTITIAYDNADLTFNKGGVGSIYQ